MDDDETVLSAFVFIETVAAIVIQTAARRFLAQLLVTEMRHAKRGKDVTAATSTCSREVAPVENSDFRFDVGVQTEEVEDDDDDDDDDSVDELALEMYELAAVEIQSAFRGFWVRDCLDVDHYCATSIQKAYRKHFYQERYLADLERIVLVQSWWRRNIARDLAAITLAYAITIQAVFRGHRVRKRFAKYRAKKLRVVTIAAVIIQAQWRAFAGETQFIRTLVDILITQTVVRRWLAERKVAALRDRMQTPPRLASAAGRHNQVKQQLLAKKAAEEMRAGKRKARASRNASADFQGEIHQNPTDESECIVETEPRGSPDPPGFVKKRHSLRKVKETEESALSTSQILADIGADETASTKPGEYWNVTLSPSRSAEEKELKAIVSPVKHWNDTLTPSSSAEEKEKTVADPAKKWNMSRSESADNKDEAEAKKPVLSRWNAMVSPSRSADSKEQTRTNLSPPWNTSLSRSKNADERGQMAKASLSPSRSADGKEGKRAVVAYPDRIRGENRAMGQASSIPGTKQLGEQQRRKKTAKESTVAPVDSPEPSTNSHADGARPSVLSLWREMEKKNKAASKALQ